MSMAAKECFKLLEAAWAKRNDRGLEVASRMLEIRAKSAAEVKYSSESYHGTCTIR